MIGFADRAYAIKERTIIMERLNKEITEERELELLYMKGGTVMRTQKTSWKMTFCTTLSRVMGMNITVKI